MFTIDTCLIWASVYHNFSTILPEIEVERHRGMENWADENNRLPLCKLEDGVVRTLDIAILLRKRSPFLEIIDDIIGKIFEGGFILHIMEGYFYQEKLESKVDPPTFDYRYYAISVSHLQTVFYILMLGYVLAVVCFVTEVMWHCYRSKRRGALSTAFCHRQT
jgi:hypothetical protein